MNERVCNRCGVTKPLDNFQKQRTVKCGRRGICKACHQARRASIKPPRGPVSPEESKRKKKAWTQRNRIRMLLHDIRGRARRNGLEYDLTPEDIKIPEVCPILGIPLSFGKKFGNIERGKSPSVDRIDNSKGYIKSNIVVVSYRANCIKRDATLDELQKIAEFYAKLVAEREKALA